MSRVMTLCIDGTVRVRVFEGNNLIIDNSITAMIDDWCNEVWGMVSRFGCSEIWTHGRQKHSNFLGIIYESAKIILAPGMAFCYI